MNGKNVSLDIFSKLNEGALWGEDPEYDKKMASKMSEYIKQLIEEFKSLGWEYDSSHANYGRYYFTKNNVKVEYCDNIDKVGSACITSDILMGVKIPEDIYEYSYEDEDYFWIDFRWSYPSARRVAQYMNSLVDKGGRA